MEMVFFEVSRMLGLSARETLVALALVAAVVMAFAGIVWGARALLRMLRRLRRVQAVILKRTETKLSLWQVRNCHRPAK